MSQLSRRVSEWWFAPMPRGRIAVLRTILYGFIFVDVFLTTSWIASHRSVPGDLYQPLFLGRLLHLPTPTESLVTAVEAALLICAALAATGRAPRLLGTLVFVLYLQWMFIGMSYGKVDHDRFGFLVALAVLPTVRKAHWGEMETDEAAGWAIRAIQVGVVLTYFLATFAKLRFGGFEWLGSATLMRAILRRGTSFGDLLANYPALLRATQWGIVLFELASPLLLIGGRIGRIYVAIAIVFHLVTYASITIIFLPHVVCLLAFFPLEKLHGAVVEGRKQTGPALARAGPDT